MGRGVTAANLNTVMTNIGTGLGTIAGLRVYGFPPKSAQPPFAFVNMPATVAYDLTMGRGSDRFTLEVHVGVAMSVDSMAQSAQADYAAGSGSKSVKAAIEASMGKAVRVTEARFGTITLAAGDYAGIVFTVDFGG